MEIVNTVYKKVLTNRAGGYILIKVKFIRSAELFRKFEMVVTKETRIGEILDHDVETAKFFFEIGMHCLGCPHSRGESIEEACAAHGTDADALVAKINAYLGDK